MSRNYRQAFVMTLCNRCLDDASRDRLRYGIGSIYRFNRTNTGHHHEILNEFQSIRNNNASPTTRLSRHWQGAASDFNMTSSSKTMCGAFSHSSPRIATHDDQGKAAAAASRRSSTMTKLVIGVPGVDITQGSTSVRNGTPIGKRKWCRLINHARQQLTTN